MSIRRLWHRPPFCSRISYFLIFVTIFVPALFFYSNRFRSPSAFEQRVRANAATSKGAGVPIGGKVEALVDNEVDKMIGMAEERETVSPYACRIPRIDPFDKSILPFVDHPRSTKCERVQPDFAFVDEGGVLRLNVSAVKRSEKKGAIVACYYQYFDRGDTDKDIVYESQKRLLDSVRLERPFVKVFCEGPNATRVYANVFSYPIPPADDSTHQPLSPGGNDVNVLIFCLESASASMVRRHLPETLRYLNESGAVIFKNFLKVGENTLPNLAVVFTGMRDRREQEGMPAELPPPKDGFYDEWPLIWKRYQTEKGYETVYVEDSPHISTFHYSGKGFRRKPTDHWYYPFWYVQRSLKKKEPVRRSGEFCFGSEPAHEIYTDILRRHLEAARGRRQFLFSVYSELSHDHTSDLERADDAWRDLFRRLDSRDALNRTIVIVMGDHGPRFNKVRRTVVGFAEERLPFLAVRLPPFLYARHPGLLETLWTNAGSRLVSMHDIHQTLLDILNETYAGSPPRDSLVGGRSLFRPLPTDRTCFQAGVPDRYCLCGGYTVTSRRHKLATKAAKTVLAELNRMVEEHEEECVTWKMDKILYFLKVPWPGEAGAGTKTYFIAFKAKPLGGMFEGVVVRNVSDDSLSFKLNTLDRINAFGGYGTCLTKAKLWKFCACRKYVHQN